jgi:hypothetical protein
MRGLLQVLNLPPLPVKGAAPGAAAKNAAANQAAAAAPKNEKLRQASDGWRQTHRQANERIASLKVVVKAHYAKEHPEIVREIDKGLAKLDEVLNNVDHRLADSLARAGKAADDNARDAELKNAKAILTQYIGYVKSEPLVAHMDKNPFGVKTDLRALLAGGLTDAAKAIG